MGLQLGEVLLPNPAYALFGVVLVLREPKFALLTNHIEDLKMLELATDHIIRLKGLERSKTGLAYLSGHVSKIRVPSFLSGLINSEIEKAHGNKQNFGWRTIH